MDKKKKIIVGSVAFLIIGAILAGYFLWGTKDTEVYRTIKVVDIEGDVSVARDEISDIKVYKDMLLENGDTIFVEEDSYLRLLVDSDKYIYVSELTSISLIATGDEINSTTEVVVNEGSIINEVVDALNTDASYKVSTPNASLSVRGTMFGVEVYQKGDLYYTDLFTFEGSVSSVLVHEDGSEEQEVLVDSGYAVKIESDEEVYVEYVLHPIDEGEIWSADVTTMSDAMLDLLTTQTTVGTKTGCFNEEELTSEVERRTEIPSYELTTTVFDEQTTETYRVEETLILKSPTVSGYTFTGWYQDITLQDEFDDEIMPDHDVEIYAGFEKTQYTITLNNGSSKTVYEKEYQDTLSLNELEKEGYTFKGWYDSDGKQWSSGNLVPAENLTLTAKWEVKSYTITLDNGTKLEFDYGAKIDLPVVTNEGHTFDGWYQGTKEWSTGDTMPAYNLSLVSKWDGISYQITLDNDTKLTFDYGSKIDLPVPTKEGYTFNGWYQGTKEWSTGDTMPANDLSLVSKWTINSYSLTLVNDGETTSYKEYGSVLDLPTVTKTGYTATNWEDSSGNTYTEMPAKNLVLTPVWVANIYKYNMYSNYPTGKYAASWNLESKYNTDIYDLIVSRSLEQEVGDEYYIEGYYLDGNFEQRIENESYLMPAYSIEIHVHWVIKE